MKKKGFTLVELLAVIAILAILVIMALPAVLRMYRQSRINNFQNEVRSAYRTAQNQFISESMNMTAGQNVIYTNGKDGENEKCGVATNKSLEITGNSKFQYYIEMNVNGQVKKVRATNGNFSFVREVAVNDDTKTINVEDIVIEDVTKDDNLDHSNNLEEFDVIISVCTGETE